MPKKKFEEGAAAHYDPFAAEVHQAAIRAAIAEPESRVEAERERAPTPQPKRVGETPGTITGNGSVKVPSRPPAPQIPEEVPTLAKTGPGAGRSAAAVPADGPAVQKRFRVTPAEDQELEAFVLRLRQGASSKVDFSVLSRAVWTVLQHAEEQVLGELKKTQMPKHPGKHDVLGIAEYEERWVGVLTQALRRMGPNARQRE